MKVLILINLFFSLGSSAQELGVDGDLKCGGTQERFDRFVSSFTSLYSKKEKLIANCLLKKKKKEELEDFYKDFEAFELLARNDTYPLSVAFGKCFKSEHNLSRFVESVFYSMEKSKEIVKLYCEGENSEVIDSGENCEKTQVLIARADEILSSLASNILDSYNTCLKKGTNEKVSKDLILTISKKLEVLDSLKKNIKNNNLGCHNPTRDTGFKEKTANFRMFHKIGVFQVHATCSKNAKELLSLQDTEILKNKIRSFVKDERNKARESELKKNEQGSNRVKKFFKNLYESVFKKN